MILLEPDQSVETRSFGGFGVSFANVALMSGKIVRIGRCWIHGVSLWEEREAG